MSGKEKSEVVSYDIAASGCVFTEIKGNINVIDPLARDGDSLCQTQLCQQTPGKWNMLEP